jgi:nucleotide-binding universal stress UspA family protein
MPKTVIVPLDGSLHAERALAPAKVLAQQANAELVLLTTRLGGVLEPETYLESAASKVEGARVRTVAVHDRLAINAIMTLAASEPDAVICLTTHARSGPGRILFGGITQEVIRHTDVPLVLVGPTFSDSAASSPFKELVVCLDGSPTATAVLPTAVEWAGDLGLEMWLVGVVDPELAVVSPTGRIADTFDSTPMERVAIELQRSDLSVNWETLHGHRAAPAIVAFAQERSSPLIAMTTHGRTGLARVVAGSVTMAVVREASCPVLVTRSRDLRD